MVDIPNHDYNAPDEGTSDWHVPLNENFKQLDIDVEIRGSEANKGDYEPKEGAKYEATDSGAVYYGNETSWVLADRKVGSLESDSFATGEHLKAGDSSTAIIAPSVSSAYNSIQTAIDDGHTDIAVAEEITENNIEIKNPATRIRGEGGGTWQTINDPQDGNPVFYVTQPIANVNICNISVRGGPDSGPAIDTRTSGAAAANLWEIYNSEFIAGPVILLGARNQLRHVRVGARHDTKYNAGFTDYDTKAALIQNGATFGIMGGQYLTTNGARVAAYVSGGAGTITGGVTITNAGGEKTGNKGAFMCCAKRALIGPCSFESSKEYNMVWGNEAVGQSGPSKSVFTATSLNPLEDPHPDAGYAKIKAEGGNCDNIHMLSPLTDLKFEGGREVSGMVMSQGKVRATTYKPERITHVNQGGNTYGIGGSRDSPSTQTTLQIHTSEPPWPEEAGMVVADGTNWDPDDDGNAELVMYNGSSWVEVADLDVPL